MSKTFKKAASCLLALSMILLNSAFVPTAGAIAGPSLTIGSATASNGEVVVIPVIADFSDIIGVQFSINYDDSLLSYAGADGCASDYINCASDVISPTSGEINILWYDDTLSNPLNLSGDNLLTLKFNVISEDVTDADLIFSDEEIIGVDGVDDIDITETLLFNNGVITLNSDETAPILSEVTPVSTPTNNNTPSYTFNSDEAGTIAYGGGCKSVATDAIAGDNQITFNTLADGTYSSCTITITDGNSNESSPLAISEFTVDTQAPSLLEVEPVSTPTNDTTPDYTFSSNEVGIITYDGGCVSAVVDAAVDNNTITFNELDEGLYNGCIITITDAAGNSSAALSVSEFIIDTTAPEFLSFTNPLDIQIGEVYDDSDVIAEDENSGPVEITHVGEVDNSTIESYEITYTATDEAGNSVDIIRIINVLAAPDETAPVLSEITPVPTPTKNTAPDYTFNSDEAGTISYGGACASAQTAAIVGENTITFNELEEGLYSNCSLTVTDGSGNQSLVLNISAFIIDTTAPELLLNGVSPVDIEAGEEYIDAGAIAEDGVDGPVAAVSSGEVNSNLLGAYEITYTATDAAGNSNSIIRTVNVVDTTAPVITLNSPEDNPASVEVGYEYIDAGATAIDNYDSVVEVIADISDVDTSAVGSYTVTYNATDNNGNHAVEVIRTVNVTADATAPVIALNGGDMNIYQGTDFTDPATASDNYDGDISGSIVFGGDTVDTNTIGDYTITYNVSDSSGNPAAEESRTVTVLPVAEGQEPLSADMLVSSTSPEILIGDNTPSAIINVPLDTVNGKLNLSAIMDGTNATIQGSLNINSETSVGDVNVQIPAGMEISGEAGWTGEVNLPQVQENSSVSATPEPGNTTDVNSVIEIGFGDMILTFDHAVRILIAGQAGKYTGYSRGGVFTQITANCSADTQAAGDALPVGGDCKIDVGGDLVVWTKHFTKFATYTQTAIPAPTPPSSGGGGGGGGGTFIPPKNTTTAGAPEEENVVLVPEEEVEVLGVETDYRTIQLNKILNEVGIVVSGDVNLILANAGKTRDLALESNGSQKYVSSLIAGAQLTEINTNAITNFIVYGTETTQILGAGERAGVINSYKSAFGKLPTTQSEWEDAIKIANGRWPSERSEEAENKAKLEFKKVYLRDADMNNANDNAAVTVIAYGLRPDNRNLDSEKAAIKIFKAIYGYNPASAIDWDTARAIAYSGAIR